jgi:hypothetical protein
MAEVLNLGMRATPLRGKAMLLISIRYHRHVWKPLDKVLSYCWHVAMGRCWWFW